MRGGGAGHTPTDKSWRAMHKASLHLCTLSDVSYISCVEVRGVEGDVGEMMKRMGGGGGGGVMNEMYRGGQREGELLLHHPDRHPYGLIAPVKFQWQPPSFPPDSLSSSSGQSLLPVSSSTPRRLWLWLHAAVYEELLQLLSSVASQHRCEVQSLRGQLCRFELTGARCQQTLAKVLKVAEDTQGQPVGGKGSEVWRLLCDEG